MARYSFEKLAFYIFEEIQTGMINLYIQSIWQCFYKKVCSDKILQGGGVAAPVGGQIFSEILPYLEVNQGNTSEVEPVEKVETPDTIGKSIKEAEKLLKEARARDGNRR